MKTIYECECGLAVVNDKSLFRKHAIDCPEHAHVWNDCTIKRGFEHTLFRRECKDCGKQDEMIYCQPKDEDKDEDVIWNAVNFYEQYS